MKTTKKHLNLKNFSKNHNDSKTTTGIRFQKFQFLKKLNMQVSVKTFPTKFLTEKNFINLLLLIIFRHNTIFKIQHKISISKKIFFLNNRFNLLDISQHDIQFQPINKTLSKKKSRKTFFFLLSSKTF